MSTFNSQHNRTVWCDIPVADLDRASFFYAGILAVPVNKEKFGDVEFAILDHEEGNGGCLVLKENEISSETGLLVYFNADGRIKDAVAKAEELGGKILEPTHSLGPHGYRAVLLDSEGNRIAVHSHTDE